MMQAERVYFKGDAAPGKWGEVSFGQKWVRREGRHWARYLFRNGDKSLHVFAHVPWAKYDENGVEQSVYFPGLPNGHHGVFDSMVMFDPEILRTELGIEELENVVLHGEDSGPIGDPSGKFNSLREP